MKNKSALTLFTIAVQVTYADTRRDWEGWVDGHGPGTDKTLPPQDMEFRVVCRDEATALARVRREIGTLDVRKLEIRGIKQEELLAVIYQVEV